MTLDITREIQGDWFLKLNTRNDYYWGGLSIIASLSVLWDLMAVKTDEEISDYEVDHLREGLRFGSTMEGNWDGIFDSNLTICVY